MRIRRARAEAFGALLGTEGPAAIVAVDRALARRVGVDGGAAWSGAEPPPESLARLSAPTEVHLSVTERCPVGCRGCYADAAPGGHEPSFAQLEERLGAIAAAGVFSVAFGGGEAMLREDLPRLAALARRLGLVPTVTTSGVGLDAARARTLGDFAQVNVSHDGVGGAYRQVRGVAGEGLAERAMGCLREAGVPFGGNLAVHRDNFEAIEETAARLEALGAVELQLVRWKPSGRARLDYLASRCTEAQVDQLPALLRRLSLRRLAIRIDCALVPLLSGDPDLCPADLVRFGVLGCEAGRSLLAMRADGAVAGCSFWREEAPAPRPGGELGWDAPALERFRALHARLPEPCASCALRPACRGGCRVVAAHAGDPAAPDPECPRVRPRR